eukprot:7786568-Heterocapsa_arctica.AAC.1
MEPPALLEARQALDEADSAASRHLWSRVLYRRRRSWFNSVARTLFTLSALTLGRSDRVHHKLKWLRDDDGKRTYDSSKWISLAHAFFSRLYCSRVKSLGEKRIRYECLSSICKANKLDGTLHLIALPMSVLLDTRARMAPNKQG